MTEREREEGKWQGGVDATMKNMQRRIDALEKQLDAFQNGTAAPQSDFRKRISRLESGAIAIGVGCTAIVIRSLGIF